MVGKGLIAISRRDREREIKREMIAEAAFNLFQNASYETVTVQDIARAAEFGKGTIYQYFESKEEILAYILERGQEDLYQRLKSYCEQSGDVIAFLHLYMQIQYEFHLNYSQLIFTVMRRKLEGSWQPEWLENMKQSRAKKMNLLAGMIARGSEEGLLMDGDSQKLARVLHNIVRGFSLESLENRSQGLEAERDLELIKQVLSRGMLNLQQEEH